MRYPLKADDFVDLYYGLYEPENVDHRVDYDTISVTADVNGVSITVVSERADPRQRDGQTKYNVDITSYVGLLPLDRDEASQIRHRTISPIEPRERYPEFIADELVKAGSRTSETRRGTIVSVSDGEEYPVYLADGSADHSAVPDSVGNTFRGRHAAQAETPSYAYSDIAGYRLYQYPLVSEGSQVQYVITDTPPEELPQTQAGVPALSLDVSYSEITNNSFPHLLDHPQNYVTTSSDTDEMCLTALTVSGDPGGQAMLGDFSGDGEHSLDFEVLHESLRE